MATSWELRRPSEGGIAPPIGRACYLSGLRHSRSAAPGSECRMEKGFGLKKTRETRSRRSKSRETARTPFQLELIRLIGERGRVLGTTSGRSLSARLGKSSNHLWQILNRGMVPSGPAILDIARLLDLSGIETEGLVLTAIQTKGQTRSRDRFWIGQIREMVARRDAELRLRARFLEERGLFPAFLEWKKSRSDRPSRPRKSGD